MKMLGNCKYCLLGCSRLSGSQPARLAEAGSTDLQAVPAHDESCCTEAVNWPCCCPSCCSGAASTLAGSISSHCPLLLSLAATQAASHLPLINDFAECPVHGLPGRWVKGDWPACGAPAFFLAACKQMQQNGEECTRSHFSCRPDCLHRRYHISTPALCCCPGDMQTGSGVFSGMHWGLARQLLSSSFHWGPVDSAGCMQGRPG